MCYYVLIFGGDRCAACSPMCSPSSVIAQPGAASGEWALAPFIQVVRCLFAVSLLRHHKDLAHKPCAMAAICKVLQCARDVNY